jgi:FkbM family methyltransferase
MLPRVNLIRGTTADYLLFATTDPISATIYKNGVWAEPLIAISRLFFEDLSEPFVLDIGANLGAYTVPMAKELAALGGYVYAYEPQRIIYYQLCGNIFTNQLDNVYAHCMAIGDDDGRVQIPSIDYHNSANTGGFSVNEAVREHQDCIRTNAGRHEPHVPLTRLDSLKLPKAPCLIKIDVEGLELQVLKGAAGTLARYNYPPLLLEAWTGDWFASERQKLVDYIAELGYVSFAIGDELIAQHPLHGRQVAFGFSAEGALYMGRSRG